MLKEFKEFAIKGNVVDMAVGIIIGAALSAIPLKAVRCGHCTSEIPQK